MNIFEFLSFDIGEFVTSLPGILIISGIVLLILALIVLGTGKKKEPVAETVASEEVPVNQPAVAVNEVASTVVPGATSFDNNIEKSLEDMSNVADVPAPATMPVVEPTPVALEEVAPVAPVIPTVALETPMEVPHAQPEVSPEISINPDFSIPKVESLETEVVPEPQITEPTPVVQEASRPIYGGANPLDNTAPVPVTEARAAYSGSVSAQEIPTMHPIVSEELPAEVKKVETNTVVQPEVVPVDEPSMPVAPVAETTEPSTEIETLEF